MRSPDLRGQAAGRGRRAGPTISLEGHVTCHRLLSRDERGIGYLPSGRYPGKSRTRDQRSTGTRLSTAALRCRRPGRRVLEGFALPSSCHVQRPRARSVRGDGGEPGLPVGSCTDARSVACCRCARRDARREHLGARHRGRSGRPARSPEMHVGFCLHAYRCPPNRAVFPGTLATWIRSRRSGALRRAKVALACLRRLCRSARPHRRSRARPVQRRDRIARVGV